MFKNPKYLYGASNVTVPANINFGEFMLSKLWEHRERVAIINGFTHEEVTYKQITQEAMNLAVSLVHIGVKKGDVVALCSENRNEYWSTVVGIACAGAVITTLNTGYTKGELKHVMNISKPKYMFCSPDVLKIHGKTFSSLSYVKRLIVFGNERPKRCLLYNDLAKQIVDGTGRTVEYEDFLPVDVQGSTDTLFISYSSGTTGLPKGVMLTHLNLIINCLQQEDNDMNIKMLLVTPWYHAMGLVGTIINLTTGRLIVYLPRFDLDLYLKTVDKYKIYQLSVVPPICVALAKSDASYDLSSVHVIYCGAAPLRSDTISSVCAKFPNVKTIYQGYGMTETTLAIAKEFVSEAPKFGSVGKVVKTTTIKFADIETRKPVGKNEEGEICIKGPLIMKGYIGRDRAEDFDDEGFFRSGDIGYYDDEGYIFIVGRLKELIKYKGYQVAPAEVEATLLQHESIKDAAVIGIPHDSAGELPLAFIVTQPGAKLTEKDVQQFIAEKLSNPKHLRGGVRFISAIPKNPSGKILRRKLHELVKTSKSKL